MRRGYIMPKAISKPNTPPEAPTVGAPGECGHDELHDRGRHHAGQIVGEEAAPAPDTLQIATEHEQGEHVEQQMRRATVQEAVGHQLPYLEIVVVQGPQSKRYEHRGGLPLGRGNPSLQNEGEDIDNDDDLRHTRTREHSLPEESHSIATH